jgi:hypothetical protein
MRLHSFKGANHERHPKYHGLYSLSLSAPTNAQQSAEQPRLKTYCMKWAQPLKRVFAIEIDNCEKYGGKAKIIAIIAEPDVIADVSDHSDSEASWPG